MKKSSSTKASSSAKAAPKKITAGKTLAQLPVSLDKQDSVSITQIENGYIVNQSGYKGAGKNQQWYNKQYYTATNPIKFGGKK